MWKMYPTCVSYHSRCGLAKCPGCGIIVCTSCFRDLQLLREYGEWMTSRDEDAKESICSLDFDAGKRPQNFWRDKPKDMPTCLLTEDAKAVQASTQLGKYGSVQRANWVSTSASRSDRSP
jgi:hypothetical protein